MATYTYISSGQYITEESLQSLVLGSKSLEKLVSSALDRRNFQAIESGAGISVERKARGGRIVDLRNRRVTTRSAERTSQIRSGESFAGLGDIGFWAGARYIWYVPRWLQIAMFVVLSLGVQVSLHYYLWRRLARDTGASKQLRRIAAVAICVLAAMIPLTIWGSRYIEVAIGRTIGWPAFIWMAIAFMLFLCLVAIDSLVLLARLTSRLAKPDPVDPNRRAFLARLFGGVAFTASSCATGVGVGEALGLIQVKTVDVSLSRLPKAMDGFVIVQITDLHVGYTIAREYVRSVVERVNQQVPDLIAITGDMVDGQVPDLRHAVAPLADLKARHGVFFVTGNHEYYAGVEQWVQHCTRLGMRVLRNECVPINWGAVGFDLAGIDDYNASRFGGGHGADLPRAVTGRDTKRELVLLAHQPRQVHDAVQHGVGLQLSGHTHGGQLWPWHYVAKLQQGGLLSGLSKHGHTQLYISCGTGYWGPPVRIGAPPEITRIVLRAG